MRFVDKPLRSPLVGNEALPGENPDTELDFHTTPEVLAAYMQENLDLADGTSNGFVTAAERVKLDALYTQAQMDSVIEQLGEVALPIFLGAPTDGIIAIYRHVLTTAITFDFLWFDLTSGSTELTILKNGVQIDGFNNIAINGQSGAVATGNNILSQGDVLALAFISSMTPENLYISMHANRSVVPV